MIVMIAWGGRASWVTVGPAAGAALGGVDSVVNQVRVWLIRSGGLVGALAALLVPTGAALQMGRCCGSAAHTRSRQPNVAHGWDLGSFR